MIRVFARHAAQRIVGARVMSTRHSTPREMRKLAREPRLFNARTKVVEELPQTLSRMLTKMPVSQEPLTFSQARTMITLDSMLRVYTEHFHREFAHAILLVDVDASSSPTDRHALTADPECCTRFEQDLKRLGLQRPLHLLRLSSMMSTVTAFVEQLVSLRLAYQNPTDHSVYFDVSAFHARSSSMRTASDVSLPAAGAAAASEDAVEVSLATWKTDFLLWRTHLPSEVVDGQSFPSIWGMGAPSSLVSLPAIACAVFGQPDVLHCVTAESTPTNNLTLMHACIAQAHAVLDKERFFFLKMSHNTETNSELGARDDEEDGKEEGVDEGEEGETRRRVGRISTTDSTSECSRLLKQTSLTQLRLFCLLHHYRRPVAPTPARLRGVHLAELELNTFFINVAASIHRGSAILERRWDTSDSALNSYFFDVRRQVDIALCDDFDSPQAIGLLLRLAGATNIYMGVDSPHKVRIELLKNISQYMSSMLYAMGISLKTDMTSMDTTADEYGSVIDTLVDFRTRIHQRAVARGNDATLRASEQLSSQLRDIGIVLEDLPDGTCEWRVQGTAAPPRDL